MKANPGRRALLSTPRLVLALAVAAQVATAASASSAPPASSPSDYVGTYEDRDGPVEIVSGPDGLFAVVAEAPYPLVAIAPASSPSNAMMTTVVLPKLVTAAAAPAASR
jgi:hypothetical protein